MRDWNKGKTMRIVIFSVVLLAWTGGCNQDVNDSIRAMNEGIKAANDRSYETATSHLTTATKAYPQNHQAWYTLGQVYRKQQKWPEAVQAFAEAVKHSDSDAMYHLRLGATLYESDKRKQAQKHIEKAIELNDQLYRAYWYAGRIYRDLGDPQKAAVAWTRACRLNPTFGSPFVRLGELYLRWDMLSEAIMTLKAGTEHVKSDVDLTDVHYYLGLAYQADNHLEKAVDAYTKAIQQRTDNYDARFQRGLAYKAMGERAKAHADLEEYVRHAARDAFNRQEANKALFELL